MSGPPKPGSLRARAFVIGAVLIPLDSYWVLQMELIQHGPYTTTISIFANAIFVLAVLALANSLVRRAWPRHSMSQAEMLAVYTMVCIGAAIAGHDMVTVLIQMTCHPYRFATPENQWASLFGDHLPGWLTVSNPSVLKGYYEGNSSLYTREHIGAWAGPAVWWTGFIVVLVFVMMCINTLVRKQWVENERLTFPVVQLPLAMTEPTGGLWRSRTMWFGFALAAGIDVINGLAGFFPSVPTIPVKHYTDLGTMVTGHPWNAIGWTPVSFYPFVIGLGFLLPTDLLFSCWFFHLFDKLQLVAARAMAWDAVAEFPYIKHQAFGGYMAILVLLLWAARTHLKQVWRKVAGRESSLDDSLEPMPYRTAAIGAVVGTALLVSFFARIGLSPLLGGAAFVVYFALATAIARMRAELGPPVHDLHFSGPDEMLTRAIGTQNLGTHNLTAMSFFYWFNRAYRGHPMAFGIEETKMAQVTRASQRRFLTAAMMAVLLGSIAAFWSYLHLSYQLGNASRFAIVGGWPMGTAFGSEPYARLESWLRTPKPPDWPASVAALCGFLFCLFLGVMRMRFYGWPFHPIGFAISGGFTMQLVWAPLAVAWIAKVVLFRYGGLKLYRRALPFFLGLILGEMLTGSLWSLYGLAFHVESYSFWGQ